MKFNKKVEKFNRDRRGSRLTCNGHSSHTRGADNLINTTQNENAVAKINDKDAVKEKGTENQVTVNQNEPHPKEFNHVLPLNVF